MRPHRKNKHQETSSNHRLNKKSTKIKVRATHENMEAATWGDRKEET